MSMNDAYIRKSKIGVEFLSYASAPITSEWHSRARGARASRTQTSPRKTQARVSPACAQLLRWVARCTWLPLNGCAPQKLCNGTAARHARKFKIKTKKHQSIGNNRDLWRDNDDAKMLLGWVRLSDVHCGFSRVFWDLGANKWIIVPQTRGIPIEWGDSWWLGSWRQRSVYFPHEIIKFKELEQCICGLFSCNLAL